jgi:cell division GTPase FtsZ
MDGLIEELFHAKEPIVLLPDILKETNNLKRLLLTGARVIFPPSESLVSVSLSQTLKKLELMFYGNGTEMEISVDHQDIYAMLKAGTISEFYENSGSDIGTTMMRVMNVPRRFRDVVSAYVLFEICEDFSIMKIAEAMNIVEEDLSEESDIIFATRNTIADKNYVRLLV